MIEVKIFSMKPMNIHTGKLPPRSADRRRALLFEKRAPALCLLCLLALMLCGCGASSSEAESADPTASPAAESATPPATPAPPPEPLLEAVLNDESAEEILALAEHPELQYVNASASTCYEALAALQRALPDCAVEYAVPLGDLSIPSTQESLVLDAADYDPELLAETLSWLPRLRQVDICALPYTNEQSLIVVDKLTDADVIWTVHFASWAVRSDIPCFSTLQAVPFTHRYTNEELAPLLKYCKDLVALDLGHNAISDLSPLAQLTKLQVLILADNPITDISALGELPELWYLELFLCKQIEDFSALSNISKLADVNLSYDTGLKDLSVFFPLQELRFVMIRGTRVSSSQVKELRDRNPGAKIVFYVPESVSATARGWRLTDQNVAIRTALINWENVLAFHAWDDVVYRDGVKILPASPSEEY